ncbi:MAG: DNA cytosine methyltransferase [Gammaproteobacteria bacterium]|nr:DNA cytosine methyltransferase [Gammaproteobacteria bacterium]
MPASPDRIIATQPAAAGRNGETPLSAVDLFCGTGGLTHGLIKEGIRVNAGIDLDPSCRYPYEHNNRSRFIERDINLLSGEEILLYYPVGDIKLLVGCAPCQPFSTYTQGRDTRTDCKWGLLNSFSRLVDEVSPQIVSMENVPQLEKHDVYDLFVSRLKNLGYDVTSYRVYCPQYGIPQTRTRLVLFASIYGPINLISPTHSTNDFLTVRDAIYHLEPIAAGESSKHDPLHRASALSTLNLRRMRASRPGGTWRDWNKALVATCHKTTRGTTYPSVYGRMEWDKPAPTVTTQCHGFGNGRFGHPEQDRAISLREAALLQTFPEDYAFVEPDARVTFAQIGRLIGNAVPVQLAQTIARSILNHLERHDA